MKSFNGCLRNLWMAVGEQPDLPPLTQEGFDITFCSLPAASLSPSPILAVTHQPQLTLFSISCATANVRTFYGGADGFPGKLAYVREQFMAHKLNFLGLQETRMPMGSSVHNDVLRLSSGGERGQLGTEMWVNLAQPFAWIGRTPRHFTRQDFVVTSASPRHVLVHAGHPDLDLDLWLLAAHSPHSGSDRHQRATWWTELTTLIQNQVSTGRLIVMIDANATTGPQDSCHVFDIDDVTSGSTHFLREFLESCDLCAPSTSTIHHGDHSTWQNPADSSEHRIDFVLVPTDWKDSCEWSSSLDSLDFRHLGDHRAVGLQMTWQSWSMPQPQQPPVKGHSRAHIDAVKLQEPLQHYHPCPWHTDIEGHVDHFNQHLLRALHEHCPPTSSGPKKSFITNEIWALRKTKLGLQRALRLNRRTAKREVLHQLFGAWKNSHTSGSWFSSFRITLDVRRVRLYLELRHRAKQLRKALASAKLQEIQRQVDSLPTDCAAPQILHKLKAVVGTTNPKQRRASPLPAILDDQGNPCTTPAALVDRWVDFFSVMEGGERLPEEALRRKWIEGLAEFLQSEMQLPADALPSLTDLELAFRRVKPHKAVGEDGIPPEVCHLYPTRLARLAYGQLLKLCTHGQEALQHKGGVLIAAWKRKDSQLRCESYRSLLISSHVAKAVHRAVRDHQSSIYETFLQGQQIGGRKHIPVSMGVHFIRAAARMAKRLQMSHALIFLDLREAFIEFYAHLLSVAPSRTSSWRLWLHAFIFLLMPFRIYMLCCDLPLVSSLRACRNIFSGRCWPYTPTRTSAFLDRQTGFIPELVAAQETHLLMSSSGTCLLAFLPLLKDVLMSLVSWKRS